MFFLDFIYSFLWEDLFKVLKVESFHMLIEYVGEMIMVFYNLIGGLEFEF